MTRYHLLSAILLFTFHFADAQTSRDTLNLHGQLVDENDIPVQGQVSMRISLYDDAVSVDATNLLFRETQAVGISNGVYNVLVGAGTTGGIPASAFNVGDLWTGIKVDAHPEMSPRIKMTATAFAMRAGGLGSKGLDESGLVDGALMRYDAGAGNLVYVSGDDLVLPPSTLFGKFGGDGDDGDWISSSNVNWSTVATNGFMQFNNFTLQAGHTITLDDGEMWIGVKGTCTIAGDIDGEGMGGAGGEIDAAGNPKPGESAQGGNVANHLEVPSPAILCLGGSGGGGGSGGALTVIGGTGGSGSGPGGAGGDNSGGNVIGSNAERNESRIQLLAAEGSGYRRLYPWAVSRGAGGGAGQQHPGKDGGGLVFIECANLLLTGNVDCDGVSSTDMGGGGGGGSIVIRTRNIQSNSGDVSVEAGSAGPGGAGGGAGADGFAIVVDID